MSGIIVNEQPHSFPLEVIADSYQGQVMNIESVIATLDNDFKPSAVSSIKSQPLVNDTIRQLIVGCDTQLKFFDYWIFLNVILGRHLGSGRQKNVSIFPKIEFMPNNQTDLFRRRVGNRLIFRT